MDGGDSKEVARITLIPPVDVSKRIGIAKGLVPHLLGCPGDKLRNGPVRQEHHRQHHADIRRHLQGAGQRERWQTGGVDAV